MLSALAILPVAGISSPSLLAFESDRQICQLASRILGDLLPRYEAASRALDSAVEQKRLPDFPDVLFWRITDPVGHAGFHVERSGKQYLVCDLDEIQRRKTKPPIRKWTFIGTDEEAEATKGEEMFDRDKYCQPKLEFAHLWQGSIDERVARRMEELIEAADRRTSETEAIYQKLKLPELCESQDDLAGELYGLVERLTALRAYSLEALRAKAAVFSQHLLLEDDVMIDGQGFDLVKSIIADLGGEYPFSGAPGAAIRAEIAA